MARAQGPGRMPVSEPPHRRGPFASPERARLRQALVDLATEGRLESVSAAALCERAGYAPERFAEQFADVRGAAMAVYLADIDEFDRRLDAAADPADPWRERLPGERLLRRPLHPRPPSRHPLRCPRDVGGRRAGPGPS